MSRKKRFNSRSREGATFVYSVLELCNLVSIHAPVRERRTDKNMIPSKVSFNSRSREGATLSLKLFIQLFRFNSRSREGATLGIVNQIPIKSVSIHAPVRERHKGAPMVIGLHVSIHAPVRERPSNRCHCVGDTWFQFTLP